MAAAGRTEDLLASAGPIFFFSFLEENLIKKEALVAELLNVVNILKPGNLI